jgi:hypothetical protein
MHNPAEIGKGVAAIKAAFVAAGRDPNTLEVRGHLKPQFNDDRTPNFEATLATLEAAVEAGVTMIEMLPIIFCRSADDLPKFYERVAKIKDMI